MTYSSILFTRAPHGVLDFIRIYNERNIYTSAHIVSMDSVPMVMRLKNIVRGSQPVHCGL